MDENYRIIKREYANGRVVYSAQCKVTWWFLTPLFGRWTGFYDSEHLSEVKKYLHQLLESKKSKILVKEEIVE